MKKIIILSILTLALFGYTSPVSAKKVYSGENYDNTLNLGVGTALHQYGNNSIPFFVVNYEFQVAEYFTIAPSIGYAHYSSNYYYGNGNNPYRNYSYSETIIPISVKGTYYFDKILNAGSKWDFYLGTSVGYYYATFTTENGYTGKTTDIDGTSPLYLAIHLGTEYHISQKTGIFLDLSSQFNTVGLAFHL